MTLRGSVAERRGAAIGVLLALGLATRNGLPRPRGPKRTPKTR